MRKINFPLWFITCSSVFFIYGVLSSDGKAGKTGAPGENTCVQCHSGSAVNSGSGSISINTASIINGEYEMGQTYDLSVVVEQTGVSLFGFSIVALDANGNSVGTWIAGTDNHLDAATISGVTRQYLTHDFNGGATADSHTFSFQWTAPTEDFGAITFYASGNAANGNEASSGDKVYTTSQQVVLAQPINVSNAENELSLLWNSQTYVLSIQEDNVSDVQWLVFDVNGKLVDPKISQRQICLSDLQHGIYLVKCTYQGRTQLMKVLR
jgi:hypothetical protein